MATRKRQQARNNIAARLRAAASRNEAHARKAVNTHPRTVALAVTTAFMPWFVPFTVHAQAQPPAPTTTPILQLTSPAGSGYVHPAQGAYLQVDQYASRAAFAGSIQLGSDAHMNVVQPNSAAVALFKDTSGQTSQIWGRVTANGNLFFTNSAGVLFGRTASVEVGSLLATTLPINEQDFLDNKNQIRLGSAGGSGKVENYGRIVTANGYTALVAPQVINDGVIIAHAGTVALTAADRVSLDLIGDGLISINVDQAAMNASIVNSGTIEANGGQVLLTARSANALLDTVINSSGVIRANSLVERNGEIVLDGGGAGVVLASGTLEAAGKDVGTTGGTVKVLGQYVGLMGEAKVDVSGDAGGGTALIGGGLQGRGEEKNATATFVGSGTSIDASAVREGDGGLVVVWADTATRAHGRVAAKGGDDGGNGGLVETSGKQYLDTDGIRVDTTAAHGIRGLWLLDPFDVTIVAGLLGAPDGTNGAFDGGNPNQWVATGTSTVDDADIQANLASTDVTILTSGAGGDAGDIIVQNGVSITIPLLRTLTLDAQRNIDFQGNASITGGLTSTLQLNIGQAGGTGGTLFASSAATLPDGVLTGTTNVSGGGSADRIDITRNANMTLSDTALAVTGAYSLNLAGIEAATLTGGAGANDINASSFTGSTIITGGGGADTLTGGSGNDSFRFLSADFTSAVTVAGNGAANEIRITDDATVVDASFTNVTGVQTLFLAGTGAQDVSLSILAEAAGVVTVDASAGNASTINASGYVTAGIAITTNAGNDTISGGGGADTISSGSGDDSIATGAGNDSIRFANANFDANDAVAAGANTDEIRITDDATISDAQFVNKTGVETLFLAGTGSQSVVLAGNANTAGIVTVTALAGNASTIDIGGMSNNVSVSTDAGNDTVVAGSGNNNISTGAADDSIRFASANLTLDDTVAGGAGANEIRITDNATVVDADFTNVTGVQTLFLTGTGAQSVTLGSAADAAGVVTVNAAAGNASTIDIGGTANDIAVTTDAGSDTVVAGSGDNNISTGAADDSIRFADANFTSADTVDGGLGANEIRITDAAAVVDADFTSVTNVQTLFLAADAAQSATLGANAQAAGIATVDATSAVTGTSNVTVDASAYTVAITINTGAGADTISSGTGNDTISSGAGADIITSGAGNDSILAGDGADSIRFTNANFAAADTVDGGNQIDEIRITDAATITDAQFANKTLVETLFLQADAVQSATLAANAQAAGIVTLDATSATTGTSNVTVDASAYTVAIAISTGAGADTITGGAAADNISAGDGNDSILYTNARFVAGETVDGGNGTDEIRITDAATITDAQFANKSNVETLFLAADAVQSATLAGNSDTAGIVTVDASSAVTATSNITVDAGGRTNAITITTGAGADTITGGAAADNISAGDGNDSIRYTNARFVAGETVNGGNGTDEIRITDAATIADAQFANKTLVETLFLQADATQSVTLAGNSDTAGIVTVDASSAVTATSNITVDAGGRTNAIAITTGAGADTITGGGGADSIVAGAGNDSIRFADANFTSADTVAGGAGANEIRITDAANVVDADFTGVTNVQTLVLAADAAQSATLAANAQTAGVVTIDATAATSGASNVTVDASGYTVAITINTGAGADVLIGGTGNDTLSAGNGNDTLTGGAGADALNGGGGANVVAETRDANFVLADTTLDIGAEGTDTLTGIGTANLTGGASNNSFTVSGWTGLGTMDGAGNTADTIIASNDVSFTLANASLARSGGQQTLTLANMESATLTGGGSANAFVLSGWTGSGSMTGNGGTDTLTGPDTANTWNVTGAGGGNINSSVNFSGFTNLAGGTAADNFVFSDGVVLAGTLSGGTGADTLNLSAYTTTTNVTLTASAANGYSGTAGAVAGGFNTIDVLSGSASANNTLTGMNAASTWTSTGLNAGTYTTSGNTLAFSNFRNWTAGSGSDTFTGANISGNLSDGGGATSLSGTITTTGTQSYLGAVTLIGNTVANSSGITFNSTLDGAFNFTSNNAGTNTFMGAIGSNAALASITTDAPGLSVLGGNVTTTGAISFLDVTTANGITMTSTNGGAVNVNGANAGSPASVSTTGNVTFQGTQIGTAGTPLVFAVTPNALTLTQQATAFFSGPSLPGSMVFPNGSSITFNNASIAQSFLQQQATTAASNASQGVTAAIVEEANKTFGTDSVAEDVEYGFAGEVGTTPPMDHRIDESGISVPRCVQESREGVPCK